MNIKDLSKPLTVDQIDFRVQSVTDWGTATILAYKDARVDMDRLDEVVGPLGWKREHSRDNHNCTVSIYCYDKKEWVSKEDTGTESMAESEKGLASDSFKRACFNFSIGRELYSYPQIQIKMRDDEIVDKGGRKKAAFKFLKGWVWYSEFTDGRISFLAAKDETGKLRFKWGDMKEKGGE